MLGELNILENILCLFYRSPSSVIFTLNDIAYQRKHDIDVVSSSDNSSTHSKGCFDSMLEHMTTNMNVDSTEYIVQN